MTRTRLIAGVALAAVFITATVTPVEQTRASWLDAEISGGGVGTLSGCADAAEYTSRSWGRVLSGELADEPLDAVADATGLQVLNDGGTSQPIGGGAIPIGNDAYLSRVVLSALGSGQLEAGVALPLAWGASAYAEYGQARSDGTSTGSAGLITDEGAIDMDGAAGSDPPAIGSLAMSELPGVGSAFGALADVELEIGALASWATLDWCEYLWSEQTIPAEPHLRRSYLVGSLALGARSAAVAAVADTATTAVGGVQGSVNALAGSGAADGTAESVIESAVLQSVIPVVIDAVTALPIAGGSLADGGDHAATAEIDVDLAPALALLSGVLSDGIVTVELGSGRVRAELSALAGGLADRAPNTQVLTLSVLHEIAERAEALLEARLAQIKAVLQRAIANATLKVTADFRIAFDPLLGAPVDVLTVHLAQRATLADWAAGRAAADPPVVTVLPDAAIIGGALTAVVGQVVEEVASTGTESLSETVGSLVASDVLQPLTASIETAGAETASSAAVAVGELADGLAAVGGLVTVTVNSRPDAAPHPPIPTGESIPAEFFVSALRIAVAATEGAGVLDLFLASSGVGPNASAGAP